MLAYFLVLFLAAVSFLFDFVHSRIVKTIAITAFAIFLVAFAGLRDVGVDKDSDAYHLLFSYMKYLPWVDVWKAQQIYAMEVGYVFLNKLAYSVGFSFTLFMLLIQVLTASILYPLIKKYSPYPMLSIIMYVSYFYFLRDFTQIRYALACALLMNSFFALSENKPGKWAVLQFCAGAIHNATWIGIFVWLSVKVIRNKYFYLAIPFAGLIVGLFDPIRIIMAFLDLPEQLTRYLKTDLDMTASVLSSILAILVLIISLIYYDKLNNEVTAFRIFFAALSFSACLGFMFLSFPIMQRVSGALLTAIIWILPWILSGLTTREEGMRHIVIVIYFSVLLLFAVYGVRIISSGLLKPYL